jgi:hypothetical protein
VEAIVAYQAILKTCIYDSRKKDPIVNKFGGRARPFQTEDNEVTPAPSVLPY